MSFWARRALPWLAALAMTIARCCDAKVGLEDRAFSASRTGDVESLRRIHEPLREAAAADHRQQTARRSSTCTRQTTSGSSYLQTHAKDSPVTHRRLDMRLTSGKLDTPTRDATARMRTRRDTSATGYDDEAAGNALYFSGEAQIMNMKTNFHSSFGNRGQQKRIRHRIPRRIFTAEILIKPEGGQSDSLSIIGLHDACSPYSGKGWTVGVTTRSGRQEDARFHFTLRTDRAKEASIIYAHARYDPRRWYHVTASYDGKRMKLYVNGAKVAVGSQQTGDIFSERLRDCKEVHVGGSSARSAYYRGFLKRVRLWNRACRHRETVDHMHMDSVVSNPNGNKKLVLEESFTDVSNWKAIGDKLPKRVFVEAFVIEHDASLAAPPCGKTICDDPEAVMSYVQNSELRKEKLARYNIINIKNDDGSSPTISEQQISIQSAVLRRVYSRYNITWQAKEIQIRNTSLRSKVILYGCDILNIGNGLCNPECVHPRTGNDGGDCDVRKGACEEAWVGNGLCNVPCNLADFGWDGGDCCKDDVNDNQMCYDPGSPNRTYVSVEELRHLVNLTSRGAINVVFAEWSSADLIGVATFPWEKQLLTVLGGVVVRPDTFGVTGRTANLVHELGHVLGLWHVHTGISEMDCSSSCLETEASMELGDLCSDTRPTTANHHCRDPQLSHMGEGCGKNVFKDTPYRNYMGYADDNCTSQFTEQQAARMHCYLDLVYQSWMTSPAPSPLPLPPRVVQSTADTVILAWISPIGDGRQAIDPVCTLCSNDLVLSQYANFSWSPAPPSESTSIWKPLAEPLQATGLPDAEHCTFSPHAWMPDAPSCEQKQHCQLFFRFQHNVIATRLTLWMAYVSDDVIRDVTLVYADGSSRSLGRVPVYCDMPFTTELFDSKVLVQVQVSLNNPYAGVDALQIQSEANQQECRICTPLQYHVTREPPFANRENPCLSRTALFTDSDVEIGQTYSYRVTASLNTSRSPQSPPWSYTHGDAYCGDGSIDAGEECDDGNGRDGDGCTITCRHEQFFICTGEPSVCYRHDGDGLCEEFERRSSLRDCGHFTPDGYRDQWADRVSVNPSFQLPLCPEQVLIGPPALTQQCLPSVDHQTAWSPCGHYNTEDFWLEVYFPKARVATGVVIYIASDGIRDFDLQPKTLSLQLIDGAGTRMESGHKAVVLSCKDNPVTLNIQHDLSQPFSYTKGVVISFSSAHIAISAVALRSWLTLEPLAVSACLQRGLYSASGATCVDPVSCQRSTSCDNYVVKHASVTCSGRAEGDSCRVTCKEGYLLEPAGEDLVRCTDGSWVGRLSCQVVDCGVPVVSLAAVDCPDGTTFGRRCKFECQSPAKLRGSSHSLLCEADGLWSLPESFCQVKCPALGHLKNATILTDTCRHGAQLLAASCRIRCHVGYVARSPDLVSEFRMTCTERATWEGAYCERVTCAALGPVYTGLYACTDGFYAGSVCTLKCPGPNGATTVTRCGADGEWSQTVTACKFPPGQCPDLTGTASGLIVYCQALTVGSTCAVACADSNREAVLKPTPSTTSRDYTSLGLTDDSVIDHVTCTGTFRWFPSVPEIACEERCALEFLGDSFCDGSNNHAQCGWDGGDCCESTVAGGQRTSLPIMCEEECECKDPNASENRHINRARRHHLFRSRANSDGRGHRKYSSP